MRAVVRIAGRDYTLTEDGWAGPDAGLVATLNTVFAPPSTEAGNPYVIASGRAAAAMGGAVVEPWGAPRSG